MTPGMAVRHSRSRAVGIVARRVNGDLFGDWIVRWSDGATSLVSRRGRADAGWWAVPQADTDLDADDRQQLAVARQHAGLA